MQGYRIDGRIGSLPGVILLMEKSVGFDIIGCRSRDHRLQLMHRKALMINRTCDKIDFAEVVAV
jgi:hypothetical protein